MDDRGILRFDNPLRAGRHLLPWSFLFAPYALRPNVKATGFLQPIQHMVGGEAGEAFAMYAGQFNAGGLSLTCAANDVFATHNGTPAWRHYFHSLNWLQHFVASRRNLHAHYALRLLGRWAKCAARSVDVEALATRVMALASDGQALARQCEPLLQNEFLQIASVQASRLAKITPRNAEAAVMKAVALLYAITAFRGLEALRPSATQLLQANIDKLILADGGHVSREPEKLVAVLAMLLPLRKAMKAGHHAFPVNSVERMLPMLGLFVPGDDGLTQLKGSDRQRDMVKAIIEMDEIRAKPLAIAPHSGFARLSQNTACLIVDTKQRCEMEFSNGPERLFRNINLTHSLGTTADLRQSSQGSLLHVKLDDGSTRTCFLAGDGADLRVEDKHNGTCQLLFEIHPEVKVSMLRAGAGLMMVTPGRTVWILSWRGGDLHMEQNGAILKITNSNQDRVNWAMKKQTRVVKSQGRKAGSTRDLLS